MVPCELIVQISFLQTSKASSIAAILLKDLIRTESCGVVEIWYSLVKHSFQKFLTQNFEIPTKLYCIVCRRSLKPGFDQIRYKRCQI